MATAVAFSLQSPPQIGPATLKAGRVSLMARNTSAAVPAEFHEMSIYAVPAGNTDAPIDLLHKIGAGELKIAPAGGLFAPPGKSLGATIDLKPGTYVYGCSIPVGGQDPSKGFHFQKGMVGTLGAK